MKDGVVIVNTARGAVIDEDALVNALDGGKVWSCGLDVYEDEPKIHPGLIANPHVMLVPHMGTWTVEVSPLVPPLFPLDFLSSSPSPSVKAKLGSPY
jgi:glyoxylate reductase